MPSSSTASTSSGTSTTTPATTAISTRTITHSPHQASRPAAWILITLAVSLAAFGGVYVWSTLPALLITTALAVRIAAAGRASLWTHRTLDGALVASAALCVAQLLPLPHGVLGLLSPHGLAVIDAMHLGYPPAWHPVSLSPRDTAHALLVFVPAIVMFMVSRHVFSLGGIRLVCRSIPWLGLALAVTGMVQATLSPVLIYGFWRPRETGALPFGPFVNRNQFATWLVLAVPICAGYLLARQRGRHGDTGRRRRAVLDGTSAWLMIVTAVMVVALAMCASRSGLIGLAAGGVMLGVLGMRQGHGASALLWIGCLLGAGGLLMVLFGNPSHLILRFIGGTAGPFDRSVIWRDSLRVIQDFWLTGVGAGAYRTVMLYYQTPAHDYIFNHAHNHALQVMVEGGIGLTAGVGVAAVAFVREAARRLREEASALFWIRAGAAAALAGVAVQSLWETGLRAPANAQLAAVAAAIVLHVPRHTPRGEGDSVRSGTSQPRRSSRAQPREVEQRQRQ